MPYSPEDTGKGVWFTIHMLAYQRKPYFPDYIRDLVDNFFCQNCQLHFQNYLFSHPVPRNPLAWFRWSVDFHNAVNIRLAKPTISFQNAEASVNGIEVCERCQRDPMNERYEYSNRNYAVPQAGPRFIYRR